MLSDLYRNTITLIYNKLSNTRGGARRAHAEAVSEDTTELNFAEQEAEMVIALGQAGFMSDNTMPPRSYTAVTPVSTPRNSF
jgi:hypothetical protein